MLKYIFSNYKYHKFNPPEFNRIFTFLFLDDSPRSYISKVQQSNKSSVV